MVLLSARSPQETLASGKVIGHHDLAARFADTNFKDTA
jgi:hypothetical protein